MKIFGKTLLLVLLIVAMLYVPSNVFASTENKDEKMVEEAQKNQDVIMKLDPYGISPYAYTQEIFEIKGSWRSYRIPLNRTVGSSGVTVTVFNYGDNMVDFCIFIRDGSSANELLGSTQTSWGYGETLLSWENNDLKDKNNQEHTQIDLFFSMYKTAVNNLDLVITY